MKSKKRQKKVHKGIIVLLVFVIIGIIAVCVINKFIGKEAILNKLTSGIYNLNYSYTTNDGDTAYICGTLEKIEYSNGNVEYIDYKNKENYLVDENGEVINTTKNKGISDMLYYKEYILNYFDNDVYKYSYKGKEEFNSYKCTTVEFVSKKGYSNNKSGEKNQKGGIKIWINDELNVIEKVEYFYLNGKDRKSLYEKTFEYHNKEMSMNELKLPDTVKLKF